jgi:hypothetical protein
MRCCCVASCCSRSLRSASRSFTSVSARSSASRVVSCSLQRSCWRLRFSRASARFTRADSTDARTCSSCARAPASDASPRWSALSRLRGSIWSRNCPCRTSCPSSTASRVTRPITSALMFTDRLGWIFPEADTMASRSRAATASTVTVFPCVLRKAKFAQTTAPPIARTATPPITLFRETFMRPPTQPSPRPPRRRRPRTRRTAPRQSAPSAGGRARPVRWRAPAPTRR